MPGGVATTPRSRPWRVSARCRPAAAEQSVTGCNRGGDRQLNRALHDITKTRWRARPRTHAYIQRRRAEGKSDPEIRRCIKRYVARELFRALTAARGLTT